jgi:hypothetical protein
LGNPNQDNPSIPLGGVERRAKRRFPIDRDVKYKVLRGDRIAEFGSGKTLNVSSSGICFTTETVLPLAAPIELSMSWPALLNDSCPMKLTIHGSVVRSDAHGTVVTVERYEFRTQGRSILTPALPFGEALRGVDLSYR